MNSDQLSRSLSILANVGVLAGLVFVAIELNQNTEQLALELQWQVTDRMYQNNRDLLGENPAAILAKAITEPQNLTFEEFQIANAILFNFLNVWEDRYFLYQAGLLEDSEWKSFVIEDIRMTLGYPFAKAWWAGAKQVFEPELVRYVDERLQEADLKSEYQNYLETIQRLPGK